MPSSPTGPVVVLDDISTGTPDNVAPAAELVAGDVADPAAVAALMAGCDVVFHLAARGSVLRSVERPLETDRTNVAGTLNVLCAAHDAGVGRVVLASSSSVYGGAEHRPTGEDAPLQPRSPYAVSKLAGEHYARVFADPARSRDGAPALLQRVRPPPAGGQPVRGRRPPLHRCPARRPPARRPRRRSPEPRLHLRRRRGAGQPARRGRSRRDLFGARVQHRQGRTAHRGRTSDHPHRAARGRRRPPPRRRSGRRHPPLPRGHRSRDARSRLPANGVAARGAGRDGVLDP